MVARNSLFKLSNLQNVFDHQRNQGRENLTGELNQKASEYDEDIICLSYR